MATRALKTVEKAMDERLAKEAAAAANMRVWNAVCRTDPRHTKRVNQRGGFTAIDAQYQIMEATRQFGPVGEGWGYDVDVPNTQVVGPLVIVPVVLWHGNREQAFGPLLGCAEIQTKHGYDKDAPKKAVTDAITKGLSQLGFNADVFLGLFDDNKYVEQVRKEFEEPKIGTGEPKPNGRQKLDGPYTCPTQLKTAAKEFVRTLESMGDIDEFLAWEATADFKEFCEQLERDMPDWWQGGPSVPAEFVPLGIRIAQKKRDLEQMETVRR